MDTISYGSGDGDDGTVGERELGRMFRADMLVGVIPEAIVGDTELRLADRCSCLPEFSRSMAGPAVGAIGTRGSATARFRRIEPTARRYLIYLEMCYSFGELPPPDFELRGISFSRFVFWASAFCCSSIGVAFDC